MDSANMIHLRAFYASRNKIILQFPILLVGWMILTSICGVFMMGFVMDGILRTVLDAKQHELLATRHLTLATAYREGGAASVEKVIENDAFNNDFIRLASRDGSTMIESNPGNVHFKGPGTALKTIDGDSEVPGWKTVTTAKGPEYDVFAGRLPGGVVLEMGYSELPQEKFYRRSEKIAAQIGATFVIISILGSGVLLFRYRESDSHE